ncbi:MAG TPA: pyridoxal phosphate-dependent aminotransferase [Thermoplasmata archaeon]|nr:pyridoxal phosphate-dependent aminotransferase [Thermoplasmata archaeon]
MRFPPFEHLHLYEDVHDRATNISLSNVKAFTFGEFGRSLPPDLDLNWADPAGPAELRALIATRHRVPADHVLVTTGATEANFLVQAALVRAGDRVVVDSPTYTPLREAARGFGGRVVLAARSCRDGWRLDLDRLEAAMAPTTRLCVFANLNNPTSARIDGSEMRRIADLAASRRAYVLVDETFRETAFDGRPPSAATFGPHMVSLGTVTKLCGLGALRVGWIVGTPRLLERFKAIKDYTTIEGASPGQVIATWALERHAFFVRRARRILDANRRAVREMVPGMPALRGDVPEGGTVFFPHCAVPVAKVASRLFRRHRTVIAPGRFFGPRDHFRIGLGGDPRELRRGLANLRRVLRDLT